MKMKYLAWQAGLALAMSGWLAGEIYAQGDLTPPGAPEPTMKTLTQVEPRTPIASAPYTITQPGSYYLTTNLVSTGHGIVIQTNGVTLDLMGFSLSGVPDYRNYGIWLNGAATAAFRDVVVRGGSVNGFGYGVRFDYAQNSRIERLTISSNSTVGARLNGSASGKCGGNTIADCSLSDNLTAVHLNGNSSGKCDGNTIVNCSISGSAGYGVYIDGRYSGECNGNTLRDCAISGGSGYGVFLDSQDSGKCNGNILRGCVIDGNGNCGVLLEGSSSGACNGNMLRDCAINGSTGDGVTLQGASGKCDGNTISGCIIRRNRDYGVELNGNSGSCNGNTLRDCAISGNGAGGVYLLGPSGDCDGNTVADCVLRDNTDNGIYLYAADGNRIENNHVSGTTGTMWTYGIRTSGSSANLIMKNTCVGQTNNFSFSVDDSYGPIVTESGAMATTNGAAALSPWANFSR